MRLILSLIVLHLCALSHAQSVREILRDAYFCETDSCATAKFAAAKLKIKHDSTQALYDYFKFFYFVNIQNYDSADYYYPISQRRMNSLNDWKLYFNSLDARINTLMDRAAADRAFMELRAGIKLAVEKKQQLHAANLYAKMAHEQHDIGLYTEGILSAKKAKQILDTTTIYYAELMNAINTIAICFDDNNQPDSALHYHFMNVSIGLEKTDFRAQSSTYNNIGNTYLKINRLDSALKYLEKSLVLAKEAQNSSSLASVYNNLGEVHLREGHLKLSKVFLDSALYYAEKDRFAPLEKRRDVYNTMYRYYQKTNQMDSAFKYQGLYIQYRDSMQDLEQIDKIRKLELLAATAEKDKEIAKSELRVKNRNLWILGVSALVLLLAALARQLYLKRQKSAQEAQLKLQEERLRISRDLHDNIGAELSYITSVIDQKTFNLKDPEKKRDYELLSNSSRHAMAQLRETIWAIKTEAITVEDFTLKLNELCQKYSSSLGLSMNIKHTGENPILKPAVVINLFGDEYEP
jgi:signal transduction histidine kinase